MQIIQIICIDYLNCCRRREGGGRRVGLRSYCIIIIAEALVNPPSFEINFRIPIKVCKLQLCFEVCSICTLISAIEENLYYYYHNSNLLKHLQIDIYNTMYDERVLVVYDIETLLSTLLTLWSRDGRQILLRVASYNAD